MKSLAILFLILIPQISLPAEMIWLEPFCYEDGTPIPDEKAFDFTYRTYYGPSPVGPWNYGPVTYQGITRAIVPNPPPCKTWWYTVDAVLDGAVSQKAVPNYLTTPKRKGKCPK